MSSRAADTVITIAARIGGKTVNLVVFVVLARELTVEDLGLYGFVFTAALLLTAACDVGIRNSVAYYIGRDRDRAPTFAAQTFLLWTGLAVVAALGLGGVLHLSVGPLEQPTYLTPSLLLVIALLFVRMGQGILLGLGRLVAYNRTELTAQAALAVGTLLLFVLDAFTLRNALWVLALSHSAAGAAVAASTVQHASGGSWPDRSTALALLRRGSVFMLGVLLMIAAKRLAFMIVSQVGGPDEGGVFYALQRITEVLTEVSLAVAVVVFSHNVRAASMLEAVTAAAESTRLTLALFSLVTAFALFTADWLVPLALGEAFAAAGPVFRVVLLATLASSVWTILFPSLSAIASPLLPFFIFLPNVILAGVLTWLMYTTRGVMGAAYALLITQTLTSACFLATFRLRYPLPLSDYLLPKRGDISFERVMRPLAPIIRTVMRRGSGQP